MKYNKIAIFSDFDGTITIQDSLVIVFDKFCKGDWRKIEQKHKNEEIIQLQSLSLETALLQKEKKDFFNLLDKTIEIRDGFKDFYFFLKQKDIPFKILSAGYKSFIKFILQKYNLSELFNLIESNSIKKTDGKWEFIPNNSPRIKGNCGICKTYFIQQAKKQGFTTIYIGDGNTDKCSAIESDIVFARDYLAKYMQLKDLSFFHFNNFFEIKKKIIELFY